MHEEKKDPPEARLALAAQVLAGEAAAPNKERTSAEREVERIANPLRQGENGLNSNDQGYVDAREMFDTTIREAKVTLTNGVMARMFPFSNKWYDYKAPVSEDIADRERHKRALEKIGDLQFGQLFEDNFYQAKTEALSDLWDFGTTCIRLNKGKRRFAHFKAIEKGQYSYLMDDEDFPDVYYGIYSWTALEIRGHFGENGLPVSISQALESKDPKDLTKKFEIVHRVRRRANFKKDRAGNAKFPVADPEQREYESIWVSRRDKDIIGNSTVPKRKIVYIDGEYYHPYSIGTMMRRAGQTEGEGLTTMMLPAIRDLNQKRENISKAAELGVNPPWYVPNDGALDEILPGTQIPFDTFDPTSRAEPVNMPLDGIQFEQLGVEDLRKQIKTAFFTPAFELFTDIDVATNRKTAFESRLMKVEQASKLITLLHGLRELTTKLLNDHLNMMIQGGKVPQSILDDLPDDYRIELTSQFAKSIESTRAEDLMAAADMAVVFEQFMPGVGKTTVKWGQAFRRALLETEISVDDLYTETEGKDLMEEEIERQNALQAAAVANQAADANSKMQQ